MQPTAPNSPPSTHPDYDFIVNPAKPTTKLPFTGLKSLPAKLALVGGGLLILLIIFVVAKSLLGGTNNSTSMISVVQEQQALIHITTAATQQQGTNTKTQNSIATIQASVTSAQTQLLAYFKTNGVTITPAIQNQKVSTTTDAQLTAAASAGTYDSTYQSIVQGILGNYITALKAAYNQTSGPKGRALLNDDYSSAQLLVQQLATSN